MKNIYLFLFLSIALGFIGCGNKQQPTDPNANTTVTQPNTTTTTDVSNASIPTNEDGKDGRIIVPGTRIGAIKKTTTRQDLDAIYGKENVKDDMVYVGEGVERQATIIYSQTPNELVILWEDEEKKTGLELIMITSETSNWKTDTGIGIGTTLTQLEAINGKPLSFSGFGWDLGGSITDKHGGALPDDLSLTMVANGDVPSEYTGDVIIESNKAKGLDKNKVVVVSMLLSFF